MKVTSFFSALIGLLLLTSCSSLKVVQDYDKDFDFSQYKTFSFASVKADQSRISELNMRRLVSAVTNELTKKGLSQTENGDLEIHLHALVKNKQTATATTDYYGYGYYRRGFGWGTPGYATTHVNVDEYREGTLIVDMVDNAKDMLVWQGIATQTLDEKAGTAEKTINNAVAKVLQGFPPSGK